MSVRVTKIGFVGLNVVRRDEVIHHYGAVIGLPLTADTGGAEAYFACGADHHVLALFRTERPGFRHVGLQIDGEGPLEDALQEVRAAGLAAELQSDPFQGITQAIRTADPDGNTVYLYRAAAPSRIPFGSTGIIPEKLGHLALFVADAKRTTDFFCEKLSFRWSDWMGDFFAFLRCNTDHHTLNFMTSQRRGMFHVAFQVRDFGQIGRACDVLSKNGIPVIWGPGRHGAGHNIFTYHRDPDGNVVEIFAEMDVMSDEQLGYFDPRPYHQDTPQRPKVWSGDQIPVATNMWGIMPPPGFEG